MKEMLRKHVNLSSFNFLYFKKYNKNVWRVDIFFEKSKT